MLQAVLNILSDWEREYQYADCEREGKKTHCSIRKKKPPLQPSYSVKEV